MIEIRHVSRRYGSVQALNDVSLHVKKGSILGLLGQNGAGKTTLLNVLTGYLAPTKGQVLIGGHDPLLEPAQAKRWLGYLPENPPLYDEMTVREYLCFASELKGVVKKFIPAHVDEVMAFCGLAEMQNRLLGHLSKGYRQRAGLAQALCGDPDVLVLDEPTVGLDPKQITEIRALIRQLAHNHTIVFSSHILSEVQQLCDHVVILDRGEVKLDAPMAEVSQSDGAAVRCTVCAPESRVLSRVRDLDGVRRVTVQPCDQPDHTELFIEFSDDAQPEKRLFALMSSMGVPVVHLSRSESSLEQIFLDVISK